MYSIRIMSEPYWNLECGGTTTTSDGTTWTNMTGRLSALGLARAKRRRKNSKRIWNALQGGYRPRGMVINFIDKEK